MEDIGNNNSSIALIQDDAMLQQHWKKMFGIIYIISRYIKNSLIYKLKILFTHTAIIYSI